MMKISICVGSACHLKGSHEVLSAFTMLVSKYKINATVDMEGSFCQGKCNEGVVIKINDEIITNVSREKVYGIFAEKVLAVIK